MKTVEAVKAPEQIAAIKGLLRSYSSSDLYVDVWTFGLNTALRISDLLNIKHSDVDGNSISLKEGKTGKLREIRLNNSAMEVISRRCKANPEDTYLFQVHSNRSNKLGAKPVSRESVARMFKEVGDTLKIKLGTHSMRKTRGYAMYQGGARIELIAKVLNHSSTASTLRYIGIEKEDVQNTYELEL